MRRSWQEPSHLTRSVSGTHVCAVNFRPQKQQHHHQRISFEVCVQVRMLCGGKIVDTHGTSSHLWGRGWGTQRTRELPASLVRSACACSHERPRASLRDALHEPSALAASQLRSYALPYCGPQWTGTRQALGAGRFTTMLHAHGRPPHRWASASVARAARHHPTVWTEVIGTTAWRSGL